MRWATCQHPSWQYLGPGKVRCKECNMVRFNPDGLSPIGGDRTVRLDDGTELTVAQPGTPAFELASSKLRIAQLEAALRPFAELMADHDINRWPNPKGRVELFIEVEHLFAAAQALGMLDPDPEGPRAEVGLG